MMMRRRMGRRPGLPEQPDQKAGGFAVTPCTGEACICICTVYNLAAACKILREVKCLSFLWSVLRKLFQNQPIQVMCFSSQIYAIDVGHSY